MSEQEIVSRTVHTLDGEKWGEARLLGSSNPLGAKATAVSGVEVFVIPKAYIPEAGYEGFGKPRGTNDLDPRNSEVDRLAVEQAAIAVRDLLESSGYDPSSMLLWGYDASKSKPVGDEHDLGHGKRLVSLASVRDMFPPSLSTDEEDAGEAWMVNPLKYALQGGTLGVFRRTDLVQYAVAEDEEYGTVAVEVTDEQLWAALKLQFPVYFDGETISVEAS